MGMPLYFVGIINWLSFITDFTVWIVLQMLYFGDVTCESKIKDMTRSTIVIRWVMCVLYVWFLWNHLSDKIRQENKRKFGKNPLKSRGGVFGAFFQQSTGNRDDDDDENSSA